LGIVNIRIVDYFPCLFSSAATSAKDSKKLCFVKQWRPALPENKPPGAGIIFKRNTICNPANSFSVELKLINGLDFYQAFFFYNLSK
jgi:hypothetical protein